MEKQYNGHASEGGVYKITNKVNGKIYIGSAKTFKVRIGGHISSLRKNRHQNKHLQASFNKFGEEAFLFEVLEVVGGDKLERTTKEQEYLDEQIKLKNWENCYNFDKKAIAGERSCRSKTPEETRKKISIAMKKVWEDPEYRKFQSEFQSKNNRELWKDPKVRKAHAEGIKKFHDSPEGKIQRETAAERKSGTTHSVETRLKISKAASKFLPKLWKDPEYRDKVIKGRKKSWANDKTRKKNAAERFRKISQKTYILQNPDGEVITIVNMEKFCKESTSLLLPNQLRLVAYGKKSYYKGWTLPGNEHLIPSTHVYKLRNPDGEIIEITSITDFCKKFGFNYSNIANVIYKSTSNYKGWTLADQEDVPKPKFSPQIIVTKHGEEFLVSSIKEFCDEYPQFKLNRSRLSLLINGHIENYKGWTTIKNNMEK